MCAVCVCCVCVHLCMRNMHVCVVVAAIPVDVLLDARNGTVGVILELGQHGLIVLLNLRLSRNLAMQVINVCRCEVCDREQMLRLRRQLLLSVAVRLVEGKKAS